MTRTRPYLLAALLAAAFPAWAQQAHVSTPSVSGPVRVKTWKALRDADIVKQDKDYSCGAASIATVLNAFYGQSITEEALLKAMDKGDLRASFDDMARVLPRFGFRGAGYAASFEQLTRLRIPVIVYLKLRKDDHFSVVRGIDEHTVWLADPSLGNHRYSRWQFLGMWETRDDATLKGRILAILPNRPDILPAHGFFTSSPPQPAALPVALQSVRHLD